MSTTINGTATPLSPEAFAALTGPEAIQDFGAGAAGATTLAEKLDAPPEEEKSFLKRHAKAIGATAAGLAAIVLAVWRGKAAGAKVATAIEAATKAGRPATEIGKLEKAGQATKAFFGFEADFAKATEAGKGATGATKGATNVATDAKLLDEPPPTYTLSEGSTTAGVPPKPVPAYEHAFEEAEKLKVTPEEAKAYVTKFKNVEKQRLRGPHATVS